MAMFDGIMQLLFIREIKQHSNHGCAYHSLCIKDEHTDFEEIIDDAQVTYIYFTDSGVDVSTCASYAEWKKDHEFLSLPPVIRRSIDRFPEPAPIFKW